MQYPPPPFKSPSLKLSRRQFGRRAIQFVLLGSASASLVQRSQEVELAQKVGTAGRAVSDLVDSAAAARPLQPIPGDRADRWRAVSGSFAAEREAVLPEVELLVPTFLGNDGRRFYGRGTPQGLQVQWQHPLGSGVSRVGGRTTVWSGAGWTGQPAILRDRGKTYLVVGAFDYNLRKIDLETREEVWRYRFDDIIKGSPTVYIDRTAAPEDRLVILQGSRQGIDKSVSTPGPVPSFRAISFRTGRELWRLDIRQTRSYSRDNDSSAIYLGDGLLFNAGENGIGYFLNASAQTAAPRDGILQPQVLGEVTLYTPADAARQGGNLVAEASPARWGDRLFVAAGSGHVYGIDIPSKKIVWDYFIGSDLDGSAVVSTDRKLFCAVEKQYIPGPGGVLKLDLNKAPQDAADWYLPVGNRRFQGWEGGIIGSVALNDEYRTADLPPLFATNTLEGYLYIGSQNTTTGRVNRGPRNQGAFNSPVVPVKTRVGASISTPIFTDGNRLVTATYNGVYLFQLAFDRASPDSPNAIRNEVGDAFQLRVRELAHFKPGTSFEATPVVWDGIVYLASIDGNLYALG